MSDLRFRFLDCDCGCTDPGEGSAHQPGCQVLALPREALRLFRSRGFIAPDVRRVLAREAPTNAGYRRWFHVHEDLTGDPKFLLWEVDATRGRDPDWRPSPVITVSIARAPKFADPRSPLE